MQVLATCLITKPYVYSLRVDSSLKDLVQARNANLVIDLIGY